MKILAVIPARAGSKGIPNKNIRIIGSKPLIYYSIKNALDSKYITDIIVTTDSEHVRIIANQMGVKSIPRKAELCGDAVTLDSVIYDAIPKETKWDYIVTMQPTSPTLKVDTLDKAIEYAISNKLDTLISAVNFPHLSWIEVDGHKKPNYKERLNRQYLPPYYIETGAFVISDAKIVTEKTRIGNKVDVYELSGNEAQDIDDFIDLQSAVATLNNQKIGIYVNGNKKTGIGHIYRTLEIADEFYSKPDILYNKNETDSSIFDDTTHNIIPVDGVGDLFNRCKENKYDIFINDILTTTIDYMNELRAVLPNAKIINFDDDGEGILNADLVFNALYEKTDLNQVKVGEKYYIPGKTFLFYDPIRIKDEVNKVFISFGGADSQNYTDRLLNIISKPEYENYNFTIVLGKAKENVEKLLEYNQKNNIEVFYDIKNMPELMSKCDIGITSRGRTGYELAMLGIPCIVMAQNKREEKNEFICEENGFNYIGLNPADEVIEANLKMFLNMKKENRQNYQKMLLSHDLKDGRKRVMGLINSL